MNAVFAVFAIFALIASAVLIGFALHCIIETVWRFLFGKDDGDVD